MPYPSLAFDAAYARTLLKSLPSHLHPRDSHMCLHTPKNSTPHRVGGHLHVFCPQREKAPSWSNMLKEEVNDERAVNPERARVNDPS